MGRSCPNRPARARERRNDLPPVSLSVALPRAIATPRIARLTRDALAIGLATGAYAVSFGVLAVAAGLSVAQTCAMSVLVFTGASQFAVVGVLGAGGGALAALAPGAVLAARNARLRPLARAGPARRLARRARSPAQLVIDEIDGDGARPGRPARARTARSSPPASASSSAGTSARSPARCSAAASATRATLGLDAMFPAAFLALLAPQLRRPGAPIAAVAGALDRARAAARRAGRRADHRGASLGVVPARRSSRARRSAA